MSVDSTAGLHARSIRLTVPLVLGAAIAVVAAVHTALALRSPSPWILPDELIYSELGKSLGSGDPPAVRGEMTLDWGLGYPMLLAPVWAIFDDVTAAYMVAKCLNAVVLSLTAIPAYFLARRFVGETHALVVALLSIAVPSMLYAGTLMTEVALYPLFVTALLAMVVALERPTLRSQAMALGAIALACTVKTLAVTLAVAYLAGVVLFHWLDTNDSMQFRARLRAYLPTAVVLAVGVMTAISIFLARGTPPSELLGTYALVLDYMDPVTVPRWALQHAAVLDLYLGVIPFVATTIVVVLGCRRRADRRDRLFAALVSPVAVAMLVAVGAFASVPFAPELASPENITRLQERNVFIVAPLFLIGLLIWLRDRPGPMRIVVAAGLIAALLPAAISPDLVERNAQFQSFALVPWNALDQAGRWPLAGIAFALVLAVVFVASAWLGASTVSFVAPVVAVFLFVGLTGHLSMHSASTATARVAWGGDPDWVDAAVGDGQTVSVLWAEPPGKPFADLARRHRMLFVDEFFNRSIGRVFELGSPVPYGLPANRVRLDAGHVVFVDGRPASLGELLLAPCYVRPRGDVVARDPATGATVYRVDSPLRAVVRSPESCS